MAVRTVGARGLEWLATLPPFLRKDATMQAIADANGQEWDILDTYLDELQRNVIAVTVSEHLDVWEWFLGLTVNPAGQTAGQRLTTILAFMSRATLDGSGLSWESVTTNVLGTGWAYQTNIPGDGTTPAANVVRVTLPFASTSTQASVALILLRSITPANTDLIFIFSDSFQLDVSQLDDDLLG